MLRREQSQDSRMSLMSDHSALPSLALDIVFVIRFDRFEVGF